MFDFLYTLIIFPIESVLSLFYGIFLKMFEIHGIAIILLSVIVNIMLLPLYNVAEKWQQKERDLQKGLKAKLDDIKAVFKGAERHMIIRTYYRQNNYHPIYSLRNIIGLAIQIPFFIAAYHLLSHMPMTAVTSSYYFIADLRLEDSLLNIRGISINVLPVVMTVINLISAFIYSGKLQKKEKWQLVIMAFIFLALLYRSPSGLVLYWTMNNIFSLIKNIIYSGKNPGKQFFYLLTGFLIFIFIYSFFLKFPSVMRIADLGHFVFKKSKIMKINLVLGFILFAVLLTPVIVKYINKFIDRIFVYSEDKKHNKTFIFILSGFVVFILTGLLAPSLLIAASPLEFVEKISGMYYNPAFSVFDSMLQAFAVFVFIPSVIFILFSDRIKNYLTLFYFIFSLVALSNIFLFTGNYGVISSDLTFDNSLVLKPEFSIILLNILSCFIFTGIAILLFNRKYYKIIINFLIVILFTVSVNSVLNIYKINTQYKNYVSKESSILAGNNQAEELKYQFTQNGKNVVVIMLDRAIGGLMAEIIKHNPELIEQMSGFKWYRNVVSFNTRTLLGSPPLFGGYEYTPAEMNKRDNETLVSKHNESLMVMPRIFLENNYDVTVTDPSIANYSWIPDLSIYDEYPEIKRDILIGKYTDKWIDEKYEKCAAAKTISLKLKEKLINFSLFRISPVFFRFYMYDNGNWLKPSTVDLPLKFIDNYSVLEYLKDITEVNNKKNCFNLMINETVHEPEILDIFKISDLVDSSTDMENYVPPFKDKYTAKHFYSMIGSLKKLNDWFSFLKENNIYNNTKIIIVSDHGRDVDDPTLRFLVNNKKIHNKYGFFHPLLMVKDFDEEGAFQVSDEFMTNADTPSIATAHLGNVLNPFTGERIFKENRKDLITIVTTLNWKWEKNGKYKFNYTDEDIIQVKENIFIKENWMGVLK